jgi:hypothetical protein
MSTDIFAAAASETTPAAIQAANSQRLETALIVVFAATAVLFVSFIAVVTGLA